MNCKLDNTRLIFQNGTNQGFGGNGGLCIPPRTLSSFKKCNLAYNSILLAGLQFKIGGWDG